MAPLVLAKVRSALEGFAAVQVLSGLLICVDLVMLNECGTLPKGRATLNALIWLLAAVCPLMVDQGELHLQAFPGSPHW